MEREVRMDFMRMTLSEGERLDSINKAADFYFFLDGSNVKILTFYVKACMCFGCSNGASPVLDSAMKSKNLYVCCGN